MTVVVFTTVIGPTPDVVRAPSSDAINPRVRYVCLTDRPEVPYPYERIAVHPPPDAQASALEARRLKILADHPALDDADIVLWHDAAFRLDANPQDVADTLLVSQKRDMVAFRHPDRTRIEDEAVAIARCGYADLATVQAQAAHYRAQGWTDQHVITSTGYSLRRRTPQMTAFNQAWWAEVAQWCWRDQMSVDYALWMTGMTCHYIPGHYRDNPYAKWFKAPETRNRRWR